MPRYEIIRHTLVDPRTKKKRFFLSRVFFYLFIYLFLIRTIAPFPPISSHSLTPFLRNTRIFLEEELERGFSALINQKFGNL